MLPHKARFGLAILLIVATSNLRLPYLQAEQPAGYCEPILAAPSSGAAAIAELGSNLGKAAQVNSMSNGELSALLLSMPTFFLDKCGHAFYAEAMRTPQAGDLPYVNSPVQAGLPNQATGTFSNLPITNASVFSLHSNPGSKRTIYLDFNGEYIDGTSWNKNFNNGAAWNALGFSQDADYAKFSATELAVMQSVWQRVAEDFSPFDVDVTTEEPAAGVLERNDSKDETYGTRALISADTIIFKACKCSGLAYVGAFDFIGTLQKLNQPAWIFTSGVGDNPKYIAESVTHEVGHTLGLSHDGSTTTSYYAGGDGWAPIMGVGFYQPLTQWSKGQYVGANNLEDDYRIMSNHGLNLKQDEDENTDTSGRILLDPISVGGIISSPTDIDYFKFTPTASGDYAISVDGATFSSNLDLKLSIYPIKRPSDRTVVDPPLSIENSDVATGLSAAITKRLTKDITYTFTVQGVGLISVNNISFTNYGSVGTYKITLEKSGAVVGVSKKTATTSTETETVNTPMADTEPTSAKLTLPDKLVLPNNVAGKAQAMISPNLDRRISKLGNRRITFE
jgi:hypothetical protein